MSTGPGSKSCTTAIVSSRFKPISGGFCAVGRSENDSVRAAGCELLDSWLLCEIDASLLRKLDGSDVGCCTEEEEPLGYDDRAFCCGAFIGGFGAAPREVRGRMGGTD